MFTERVTGLESHHVCPKKAHEVPRDPNTKTIIAMYAGDIGHIAHQYPETARKLAKKFCGIIMEKLVGGRDNILLDQLNQVIDKAEGYIEKWKDWEQNFEVKFSNFFNETYLTGSVDNVLMKDGIVKVHDYKISSNAKYYGKHNKEKKIYESDRSEKLQPYIYSYYAMDLFGVEEVEFSYVVYVKKNVVQDPFYITELITKEKAKKVIDGAIENYELSETHGIYMPKENKFCRGCPLGPKGDRTCPLFGDKSEITSSSGGDILFD